MGDDLQQALIKSATHGRSAFGSAFRKATHWGSFPYHNPVDTPVLHVQRELEIYNKIDVAEDIVFHMIVFLYVKDSRGYIFRGCLFSYS